MSITVIQRCSYVVIFSVCGYLSITMIKKIFRRDKKTKTPKLTDSVNSLEISSSRLSEISKDRLLSDDEQGDDVSDSASLKVLGASTGSRECSSSECLNYGHLSEEARETKAEYKKTARKLNVAMQKLRFVVYSIVFILIVVGWRNAKLFLYSYSVSTHNCHIHVVPLFPIFNHIF